MVVAVPEITITKPSETLTAGAHNGNFNHSYESAPEPFNLKIEYLSKNPSFIKLKEYDLAVFVIT